MNQQPKVIDLTIRNNLPKAPVADRALSSVAPADPTPIGVATVPMKRRSLPQARTLTMDAFPKDYRSEFWQQLEVTAQLTDGQLTRIALRQAELKQEAQLLKMRITSLWTEHRHLKMQEINLKQRSAWFKTKLANRDRGFKQPAATKKPVPQK